MPREHGVLLLQGGPQGSHLEDVKNSRRPDLDGFIHVFIAPLDVIARHKVLLSTLTARIDKSGVRAGRANAC